ncbi:MAG: NMD3-related protein [Archaeoglobaceae archaeon]
MHPAKIQLRGFDDSEISKLIKKAEELKSEVIKTKFGVDIFFDNVEDARMFISKIQKEFRIEKRMSTENLGFKKGRGRFLFVYSVRKI